MTCRRCQRQLERAFVGGMAPRRWEAVRTHVAECVACRDVFERLWAVDSALAPGTPLPPAAVARVAAALVIEPSTPRPKWTWVGVTGALAAAVLVAWCIADQRHEGPKMAASDRMSLWRARGLPVGDRPPGIRLLCVEAGRVVAAVRAVEEPVPAEPLICKIGSRLQLTYSTPSLEGLTMVVVATDPMGDHRWYAPADPSEPAVALVPDTIDRTLEWSTRIEVLHRPGIHEVSVVFFDHAVNATEALDGRVTPIDRLRARLLVESMP